VTRKRITAARQSFKPDQNLISGQVIRFCLPPENIAAVLSAFGAIPEAGQRELLDHLLLALNRYRFGSKAKPIMTPSKQRNQLRRVEITIRRLLTLLGLNGKNATPPSFWDNSPDYTPWQRLMIFGKPDATGWAILMRLASAGINDQGGEVDRVNAELATASDRTAEAARLLLWLRSQAELAERRVRQREGWGGSRNRPTPKGALIRDAITIYAHMRKHYPDSGNTLGYGKLRKFIRAVAALASVTLADREIEEVWRVRDSSQK
jgi:hypothetical protein